MAKKNKRVKSAKPLLINLYDWKTADELIREVGDLQNRIAQKQADAKADIDRIKDQLQHDVASLQKKITRCVDSLEAFAETVVPALSG